MSAALTGYLFAGMALLLFTCSMLMTKTASRHIDLGLGFLISTFVNVVFAALALGVQVIVTGQGIEWNSRSFWLFAGSGVFSTYLGRFLLYEAVVRFGAAKASVFQVSSPLFTALVAWVALGEELALIVFFGMFLSVLGLILVSAKPRAQTDSAGSGALPEAPTLEAAAAQEVALEKIPAAVPAVQLHVANKSVLSGLLHNVLFMGVASSFAYSIGNVFRGAAIRTWNEPILGALIGAAFGLLLHLLFTPGKAQLPSRFRQAKPKGAWLYALIGVWMIGGQMCTIAAMRFIPVSVAALVTLCTPLLIFPLSHLLFRNQEKITRLTLLGCTLTLTGVYIIVTR
ncbi:MAG: DMT family transporter [Pseudomonadota bacterium]